MHKTQLDRRDFLAACTRAGIASPLLPGILYTLGAQAQEASTAASPAGKPPVLPKITPEMLDQAAILAGVGPFTAEQKAMMLDGLNQPAQRLCPNPRPQAGQLRGAVVCLSSAACGKRRRATRRPEYPCLRGAYLRLDVLRARED